MRSKVAEKGNPMEISDSENGLPPSIIVPAIRVVTTVARNRPMFSGGMTMGGFSIDVFSGISLTLIQTVPSSPVTSASSSSVESSLEISSWVAPFNSSPMATHTSPLVPIFATRNFSSRDKRSARNCFSVMISLK